MMNYPSVLQGLKEIIDEISIIEILLRQNANDPEAVRGLAARLRKTLVLEHTNNDDPNRHNIAGDMNKPARGAGG